MEHIRQTIVLDGEWWGKGQIFLHLQGQQGWWTLEKVKTQIPWIQGFRFVGFQISDWCSFFLDPKFDLMCSKTCVSQAWWRLGLHRAIQPPHPKDGTEICRRIFRLLRYYTSKTAFWAFWNSPRKVGGFFVRCFSFSKIFGALGGWPEF